jgi:hypothetical protein
MEISEIRGLSMNLIYMQKIDKPQQSHLPVARHMHAASDEPSDTVRKVPHM